MRITYIFLLVVTFDLLSCCWGHGWTQQGRHNNNNISEQFLVTCGPTDLQCKVERTEVNGMLIMLRRECSDTCYPSCRIRGFGINSELCENCCGTNGCNNYYPTSTASSHHSLYLTSVIVASSTSSLFPLVPCVVMVVWWFGVIIGD
ncbi:hypothetical protein Pmani_027734 [Petrolisthes manimaculis]|uniref:Snake toxin/toxin-like domain-containing protein n=1 Tax=Petrolisthes manimaculis TaxID=1843537 RepID=A0AAE1TW76_9EUCA|nr:hypothetical protein Pmani_027734 [Petrolisthes manimaculis]